MRLFTVKETSRISGLNAQTLRNWVTAGLVTPARSGTTGTGKGHRFSQIQIIAAAAGVRYRSEGTSADRVAGLVRFLASYSLERLEADFAAGRTFPMPAALLRDAARAEGLANARLPAVWLPGRMVEPPSDESASPGVVARMRRIDLPAIKEDVERQVAELSRRSGVREGQTPAPPKVKRR